MSYSGSDSEEEMFDPSEMYDGPSAPEEFITFWGDVVTKDEPVVWDVPEEAEDAPTYLHLRNLALHPDAKGTHVVQVTVLPDLRSQNTSEMVSFVIATLVPGRTEQVSVDLVFESEVTVSLLSGSGPLHLAGHVSSLALEQGMREGEGESEAEESEGEESEEGEEGEEESEGEEEESEEEAPKLVKAQSKNNNNNKQAKKTRVEEEEEEEEPKRKVAKREGEKKEKEGEKKEKEGEKKTPSKGEFDEVMKKILASPNRPKKEDKFSNYVKNTYKVTDDALVKNLWNSYKKTQNI